MDTAVTPNLEFEAFAKIPRLSRDCVITEKIDGTNAQVYIFEAAGDDTPMPATLHVACVGTLRIYAGSRNRYITLSEDNYGFARWVADNADQLAALGPGRHYGEWWGLGIQRNYSQIRKRFSLFNTSRWATTWRDGKREPLADGQAYAPDCCDVVPVLYRGPFEEHGVLKGVKMAMQYLSAMGSAASPGFMKPEGIAIYHAASGSYFKKTLEKDEAPKGQA